ncbi:MAG: HAD-IC family P-type ATPase, partial [Rhodobacteraceae bacterium]|nr:HAD-IC family P-type ATPase [Paracoccaceae bacterium]
SLATALSEAPANVTDIHEVPGHGIEGVWQGKRVRLGRADWVGASPVGCTATYLGVEGGKAQAFTFNDAPRPGADEVVSAFQRQGLAVTLLSGDVEGAVGDLAGRLGIKDWQAQALPEEKSRVVQELTARGEKVLMIGDGLNDTAALAAAHVSISPASALEATRVVSDIVLLGRSLAPLAGAVSLARSATRRIKENFAIAAGYNAVAIPIALAGFATPLAAALAMSASSISVSVNALRLRRGSR